MFCSKCGSKSIEGSAFCQKCGAKLITDEESQQAPTTPTHQSSLPTTPQVSATVAPKKKSKKLLFGLVGVVAVVIIAIVIAVSSGDGDPASVPRGSQQQLHSNSYIRAVQGGYFLDYTDITIGEAFNDFFGNPSWEYIDLAGMPMVEFEGLAELDGEEVTAHIQFMFEGDVIDDSDIEFYLSAFLIDNTPILDHYYESLVAAIFGVSNGEITMPTIGEGTEPVETDIYYVQHDDSIADEYLPTIILHADGTFTFRVNLLYGMGQANGTYNHFGRQYTLYILESDFENYDTFAMELDGDSLIFRGDSGIGATAPGTVFYRADETSTGTTDTSPGSAVMYSSESYPFVSVVPDFLAFVTDGNTITNESNTEISNVNMITTSFRHHYDWSEDERIEYFSLLTDSELTLYSSRDGLYEWQHGEIVVELYFDEPGVVYIMIMDLSIEDGPG